MTGTSRVDLCALMIIPCLILLRIEAFRTEFTEQIKTQFMFGISHPVPRKFAVYYIM